MIEAPLWKAVRRLAVHGLQYKLSRLSGNPPKPRYIEMAVTNRCNARCTTCNIWRLSGLSAPGDLDLPVALLEQALDSPVLADLVELVITGGEPFLRRDLVEVVLAVAKRKETNLKRLRTVVIPTNGLLTSRIVAGTASMVSILGEHGVDLVIDQSLNALGSTHDTMKGVPGAHEKVLATIAQLRELRRAHANLYLGLNIVVTRHNVDEFQAVIDLARAQGLFWLVSPLSISPQRFRNSAQRDDLSLSPEAIERLASFYLSESRGVDYCFEVAGRSYRAGRRLAPCVAASGFLFLDANGDVYPCPVLDRPIGNLHRDDMAAIWTGVMAGKVRRGSGKHPTCQHCLEFGSLRCSAVLEGITLATFLFRRSIRNGTTAGLYETLMEYGLTKYLSSR